VDKNMKIVKAAGGILMNEKGQVALIKMSKHNAWGFPKGRIEENEDELATAQREIYEETGINKLDLIKKIGNYQRPAADGRPIIVDTAVFLFRTNQSRLNPIENDISKALWVDKEKVVEVLSLPKDREFFESVLPNLDIGEWKEGDLRAKK